MPLVAIGDGLATIDTNHDCTTETTSDQCSDKVFIEGTGVVRLGDKTTAHGIGAPFCPEHSPPLNTASGKVFVQEKGVGRVDDEYGDGEIITEAGQSKVNAG